MTTIIEQNRSIIPNIEMHSLKLFKEIVQQTGDLDEIGAFHLGSQIVEDHTLEKIMSICREYTKKPIIYDALPIQIDDEKEAKRVACDLRNNGLSAVVLFPLTGRDTLERWLKNLQEYELEVIIGTHPSTYSSWENSYLGMEGTRRIYFDAIAEGVTHFYVPSTQPTFRPIIDEIKTKLKKQGKDPIFFSADYFDETKSGIDKIYCAECPNAQIPGHNFHPIVGEALYNPLNIREAAKGLYQKIIEK